MISKYMYKYFVYVGYGNGINATFNNILVIYCGGQFYWWRKPEYPEKTTCCKSLTNRIT